MQSVPSDEGSWSLVKYLHLQEEAPGYVLALYKVDDDFARQAIYHLHESETMPWNPFDIKEKVDAISKAEKCIQNLKVKVIF